MGVPSVITNMPGPHFLVLYGIVIAVTLLGCWLWVRTRDASQSLPLPKIPTKPDPFKVAFLRGGENEVTRLVIFGLLQRGYLKLAEKKKFLFIDLEPSRIAKAKKRPSLRYLSKLERIVYDDFSAPLLAKEVFKSLPEKVKIVCSGWQQQFEEAQLLSPTDRLSINIPTAVIGASIILGLGLFKLMAALSAGRTNIKFLVVAGLAGTIFVFAVSKIPRLTRLGKRYVEQLQRAFDGLQAQIKAEKAFESTGEADPALLLGMGVFGVGLLKDTQYAYFHDMFQSSAGGCGGGGGGCGGGGCGGCGG